MRFGDTIHVGNISNLGAARSKSANSAITYETVTETNTDITIATHEYQAMAIEDVAAVQANRDSLQDYAGKMGYSLALAVDDVLAGLVDNLSSSTAVGTLAVENTDDELLSARQALLDADVPLNDVCWIFSPAAETGLLKMDRFVHADYGAVHGSPGSAVDEAYTGSYYRIPALVSSNVEGTNAAGHDNVLLHRQTLALVMQMKPKMRAQYDIDYLTDKVAVQQLYGTKEMREDHGVWVKGA